MKRFTILLLAIIYLPVTAQIKSRIRLFYQEPQVGKLNADPDSVKVYVMEPFQQTRTFSNEDLGYETSFDFTIEEYCPVQVCKNNQCIDLFIDSNEIQILVNPEQFKQSKSLNSPLSEAWQSTIQERDHFFETQADSLDVLFKQQPDTTRIVELYKYFNDQFKQIARGWITKNTTNAVGWNLLLRSLELYDESEIYALINAFNASLSSKSTEIVKTRSIEHSNFPDRRKSIFSVFDLK